MLQTFLCLGSGSCASSLLLHDTFGPAHCVFARAAFCSARQLSSFGFLSLKTLIGLRGLLLSWKLRTFERLGCCFHVVCMHRRQYMVGEVLGNIRHTSPENGRWQAWSQRFRSQTTSEAAQISHSEAT